MSGIEAGSPAMPAGGGDWDATTAHPGGDPRGKSVPTFLLCVVLLSAQLLPPLPQYFHLAPSMAAGMLIAAGICILVMSVCWAVATVHRSVLDVDARGLILIAVVVTLVALHGAVADQIAGLDVGRFTASMIPLLLLLCGGLALSSALRVARPAQIETISWVSFWVFWVVLGFKAIGLQPGVYSKSTFPFTETSHFALAFGPVFLYRCARARPSRRTLWMLLALGLALVAKSGAFLAVALLAAMVCRRFLLVALLTAVIAVAGLAVQFKYFTGRVDLSDNSSNVSALVYLEGWEMLDSSLTATHGWGVGFQQLGVGGSDVSAAEAIRRLTNGYDLNLQDGSFVLSKLGSEFGVLGILLVAGYCLLALRSYRALRSARDSPNLTLARCIVLSYAVDVFVRGTGYFTQSTLVFVGALLVLAPVGGFLRAGRGAGLHRLLVLR